MPLETGNRLCTVTYDRGSIWNTYQEVTYKLPRRLRGVTADTVENIGNNVSIIFENMDFGRSGTSRVEICWRSEISRNSIQMLFTDEETETREMIDVGKADAYTGASLALCRRITGKKKVSLTFLPGARIDIAWIRFQE